MKNIQDIKIFFNQFESVQLNTESKPPGKTAEEPRKTNQDDSENIHPMLKKYVFVNKVVHELLDSVVITTRNSNGRFTERNLLAELPTINQIVRGVQYLAKTPGRKYIRIVINFVQDQVRIFNYQNDEFDGSDFVDSSDISDINYINTLQQISSVQTFLQKAVQSLDS